jgi:hypothetical protein
VNGVVSVLFRAGCNCATTNQPTTNQVIVTSCAGFRLHLGVRSLFGVVAWVLSVEWFGSGGHSLTIGRSCLGRFTGVARVGSWLGGVDFVVGGVHTGWVNRTTQLSLPVIDPAVVERTRRAADLLRPYVGKYVARLNDEIVVAADTPVEVFVWLRAHEVVDAVVFLVPIDPVTATNVA